MKRYIAFHNSMNSGIKSKEAALQWAQELLGQGKVGKVHIAEVIEVVERSAPPISVKQFFVELDDETEVEKAA